MIHVVKKKSTRSIAVFERGGMRNGFVSVIARRDRFVFLLRFRQPFAHEFARVRGDVEQFLVVFSKAIEDVVQTRTLIVVHRYQLGKTTVDLQSGKRTVRVGSERGRDGLTRNFVV